MTTQWEGYQTHDGFRAETAGLSGGSQEPTQAVVWERKAFSLGRPHRTETCAHCRSWKFRLPEIGTIRQVALRRKG